MTTIALYSRVAVEDLENDEVTFIVTDSDGEPQEYTIAVEDMVEYADDHTEGRYDDELDVTEFTPLIESAMADADADERQAVIDSVFGGLDSDLWISTVYAKLDGTTFNVNGGSDNPEDNGETAEGETGEYPMVNADGMLEDEDGNLIDDNNERVDSDGYLIDDEDQRIEGEDGEPVPGAGYENGVYDGIHAEEDGSDNSDDSENAAGDTGSDGGLAEGVSVNDDETGFVDEEDNPVDATGRLVDDEGYVINGEGKYLDSQDEALTDQDDPEQRILGTGLNKGGGIDETYLTDDSSDDSSEDALEGEGVGSVNAEGMLEDEGGNLVDDDGNRVDSEGYLIDEDDVRIEENDEEVFGTGYDKDGYNGIHAEEEEGEPEAGADAEENGTATPVQEGQVEADSSDGTYTDVTATTGTPLDEIYDSLEGDDDGYGVSTVEGRAFAAGDSVTNDYDDDTVRGLSDTGELLSYITAELPSTLADGDEDLEDPTLDDGTIALADNLVVMERLANWIALRSDGTEADQDAGQAIAIVRQMASLGMTVDEVISYFNGGAIDPTGTNYTDPDVDTISDDEMTFALQSFTTQYDVGADVTTPIEIELDDGTMLSSADGAGAIDGDATGNLSMLAESGMDGNYHVDDIDAFLNASADDPDAYKTATSQLLDLLGIRSPEGEPLATDTALVTDLAEMEPYALATMLAQPTYNVGGGMAASVTVTPTSAMAALRTHDTIELDPEEVSFEVDVSDTADTADTESYTVPVDFATGSDGEQKVTDQEFYGAVNGMLTGTELKPDASLDYHQGEIAAIVSVMAGIMPADALAIIGQMATDGMTLGQLFMTMNSGRVNGIGGGEAGASVTYADGVPSDMTDQGATTAEARWGLADYAASREDLTVGFEGGSAEVADGSALTIGGTAEADPLTLEAGQGQEIVPLAIREAYGLVDKENPTLAELQAVYDAVGADTEDDTTDDEDPHQQKIALSLVLDVLGFERENGMPLPIEDSLVTALYDAVDAGSDATIALTNFLDDGDTETEPDDAEAVTLLTMQGNVNTLLDTATDSLAVGSAGSSAITDNNAETDDFIAGFRGGTYETRADAYSDFVDHILEGHQVVGDGDDNAAISALDDPQRDRLSYLLQQSLSLSETEADKYIGDFITQDLYLEGVFDLLDGQTWNTTTEAVEDNDDEDIDGNDGVFGTASEITSVFETMS